MNHDTYRKYSLSKAWKFRRDRYYHEHGGAKGYVCCVTGCNCRSMLELNHLSYDHAGAGKEYDWELCWMCDEHHEAYHRGEVTVHIDKPFWARLLPR